MCTILVAWRCVADADVVLAANRDELIARASAPPGVLREHPRIVGGQDLIAGGTWLAVAADGRLCAVTNRRTGAADEVQRDPDRRSRGEIPLAALTDVDEAGLDAFLRGLGPGVYNPVNVLYASARFAVVAHVDDEGAPRVTHLAPGAHVLTVHDVDDAPRAKDAKLMTELAAAIAAAPDAAALELRLRTVLADETSPTDDPLDATCIHGDVYGTVSASTVVISDRGVAYRYAPGRPCATPFDDVPM